MSVIFTGSFNISGSVSMGGASAPPAPPEGPTLLTPPGSPIGDSYDNPWSINSSFFSANPSGGVNGRKAVDSSFINWFSVTLSSPGQIFVSNNTAANNALLDNFGDGIDLDVAVFTAIGTLVDFNDGYDLDPDYFGTGQLTTTTLAAGTYLIASGLTFSTSHATADATVTKPEYITNLEGHFDGVEFDTIINIL